MNADLKPENDIEVIKKLIKDYPTWNRRRLSIKLETLWNWRTPNGALRDMACRTYLLKLDRQGLIQLPSAQRPSNNDHRRWKISHSPHSQEPVDAQLSELRPLQIIPVRENQEQRKLVKCLIDLYHYLGYRGTAGESLPYLIYDRYNRLLACLLFTAAAWTIKPRDSFIGWNTNIRRKNLPFVINNQRFLILPWVKCYNLASHILSQISKRISSDYQLYFQHPLYLMETFVHSEKFHGASYQAANWIRLGQTTGRTRNDRYNTVKEPIKHIYIYPLEKNFRQLLVDNPFHSLP